MPVSRVSVLKNRTPLEDRLDKVDRDLSTRYDALNVLFAAVEQHLKSMKPPHDVWTDYNHTDFGGFQECELLGLVKLGDKWRLCHAYDEEIDENGPRKIQPLVECPIEIRIEAAKEMKSLKEEIVKAKEAFIPQVDEAIKALTELCNES